MKPNWDNAPSWANYLAMDEDGEWWWHESEPSMGFDLWVPSWGRCDYHARSDCYSMFEWKESLESRPE